MEECALLVCEALGVHMGEEVSVEKILSLYQDVYHTAAQLRDTQRAVTKVRSQNGGLPCSGRWILYVLLEMEKERENREKLLWELQMLKSGVGGVSDTINTQPLSTHTNSKYNKNRDKKPCGLSGLLRRARKLCVRLDDDGIWSILPSPSLDHVTSRRPCLINPTKADVLLLQQYKYDIIKERLYREMLQEEHGIGWWESMDPLEQSDCVCDVEQRAEEAFQLNDVLRMCELPGAFNCYRSMDEVLLHSCPDEVGVTEQAWTSSTSGQSWMSIIFLSVLRCHCEEERRAITQLINRVERLVLIEIYLSVFVSVRRIERETHTHAALLTARQHWDNKWPYTRRLDVEELGKFWLQEKQTPVSDLRDESRTSRCVWQAVLQYVVLCQEKERRTLLEILHSVSQEELQEERHTLKPVHKMTGSALRQGCVSLLRQMKSSLQCSSSEKSSVSWAKCAVHLLTQLTHKQDLEVQTLIHTLPAMDSAALMDLLHKYELEVRSPKLHNLHNLLQTSNSKNTHIAISAPDSERTEQRHKTPSHCEEQEICTGCGVVLVPEDTPYLEILGVGEKRDEERREGGEEEEEERREGNFKENKERDGRAKEEERICRRQDGEKEGREGRVKKVEEKRDERKGEEEERSGEKIMSERLKEKKEVRDEEEKRNDGAVEKQGSLIALAWSKPASNNTQVVTALHEAQMTEGTSADTHISDHTHSALSQLEHTPPAQAQTLTHTLVETLQEQSTSSMNESSSDEHGTSAAALGMDLENTPANREIHTEDTVCDAVCEEQQLLREATMRSLVEIQRRAEQRWQRDRDRQKLRVQERLSIIQNRKSDEDLLGLRREETFRHLTNTLQLEDEQQQKVLVREKLQQLWRERSYILQSRRERNKSEFEELLTPTAQFVTNTEDGLTTHTHTDMTLPLTHQNHPPPHTHM